MMLSFIIQAQNYAVIISIKTKTDQPRDGYNIEHQSSLTDLMGHGIIKRKI